jgi:hypothetical protein
LGLTDFNKINKEMDKLVMNIPSYVWKKQFIYIENAISDRVTEILEV